MTTPYGVDIDKEMNPEFIGQQKGKNKNIFRELTSVVRARYIQAFSDENITVTLENINHKYAIFPKSFYHTVSKIDEAKTIDFIFYGSVNWNKWQTINRAWIFDFISKYFTDNSFYVNTILTDNHVSIGVFDYSKKFGCLTKGIKRSDFDTNYFYQLKKSKFCLCPAGDRPWSIRFYEALMCKAIPIVKYSWETWRSLEERKLDYKYYLVTDKEFIYREDWAEHNYALFMRYHTLEMRSPEELANKKEIGVKCIREGCNYQIHSKKIGDGTHCCIACQNLSLGKHGQRCERALIQNV